MRPLNDCLLKLSKRAEKYTTEQLASSFVDVGPLSSLLKNSDNQIIYGRRGTGKTHVLSYLYSHLKSQDVPVLKIDMRTMGSTGGIYSDPDISLSERATRLLSDTLLAIHDELLDIVINDKNDIYDLSILAPRLDKLADDITDVQVAGKITTIDKENSTAAVTQNSTFSTALDISNISITAGQDLQTRREDDLHSSREIVGEEKLRIHFGTVAKDLKSIVAALPAKSLWVLIDEWSEIPLELQPFLADLLRRTLYPTSEITVKIAAIEQRCNFQISLDSAQSYIGIEIGADAAASLNLDEFMVFDNNNEQAKEFFLSLLYEHVKSVAGSNVVLTSKSKFRSDLFTQTGAFEEFVRASEGVPRDAINIIGISAQKANEKQISIPNVRDSARTWYHRSKTQALSADDRASSLLHWIINVVIGERRSKAFLVHSNLSDPLINKLYDSRILHLIKEGVSAQKQPGQRFNVFSLDYGCYVDLLSTNRAPKGLMSDEEDSGEYEYMDVPKTDFRSIRTSILNMEEFYCDKSFNF